jgi:iron complex transport system permease protein
MRPGARTGLVLLVAGAIGICLIRILIDRDPTGVIGLALPAPEYARYRWVSALNAVIAGVALSVSGLLLQALLRNPLASPYILGVSSGAGLGVMGAFYAAYATGAGDPGVAGSAVPAAAGGLITLGVVYALSQRRGWLDPVSLILIGVVMSTICAAGIMFLQHLVPTGLRGEFTTWLMGYIPEDTPTGSITLAGAATLFGLGLAFSMGRALDIVSLGDDEVRGVGLSLGPTRLLLFTLAGVLAAIAVTLVGPIGFVGLIAPHAARLVLGPAHRALVPGAALCGVILLVGADAARQAIDLGAGRMPPGVFTALIGGPLFIWVLLSQRNLH